MLTERQLEAILTAALESERLGDLLWRTARGMAQDSATTCKTRWIAEIVAQLAASDVERTYQVRRFVGSLCCS